MANAFLHTSDDIMLVVFGTVLGLFIEHIRH